ncbi:MAG: sulfite exporter TauE/SafE family protein [Desulfobacterota bacterium]|jgi:hypothetical protein|nr:sulfite exporter TauE/SafE family protein [Thermodesulfobacteriota bacterium]
MLNLFIGLLAGLFGGLVGIGGGVVMIPLMVGVQKLTQHQAHGTSLVALVFTGLSGAATYFLNGSLDFVAGLLLAATASITARFGARSAHALPEWQLKRAFGGFLLLVALLLIVKPYLAGLAHPATGGLKVLVLLGTGVFTGFVSGMMGVGGGTVMVPAMVLLAGFGQHTAQGTSLLAMVPAGAAGAYTHWRLGNVVFRVVPLLIPGILLGTYLGGTLANRLPDGTLRIVFALLLVWTGVRNLRARAKQAASS